MLTSEYKAVLPIAFPKGLFASYGTNEPRFFLTPLDTLTKGH